MKKILSVTLISALALVFSAGCSSKSENVAATATVPAIKAPESRDAKIPKEALYVKIHDNEKVAHAIKKAGEKTGWNITEFKSNEVIAEKTSNGETVASTLKFSDGYVDFSDNAATIDLRKAILAEIINSSSTH